VVITPAVFIALAQASVELQELLAHHHTGDFGNLCAEDREVNRKAILRGCRVLSQYDLPTGERIWIISDPGARTTVLLAREY